MFKRICIPTSLTFIILIGIIIASASTIILTNSQTTTQATLVNVTVEVNFTHLNVSVGADTLGINWSSLVLYMPFDDNISINTTYDYTNNNNDGNISGAAFNSSGIYGGAYDFDGIDDYINVSDSSSLDLTSKITISAWVYPKKLANFLAFITKSGSGDTTTNYFFGMDGSGYLRFDFYTGGWHTQQDADGPALTTNSWNHVVVTYDKVNVKMYMNGVEVYSNAETTDMTTNALYLSIGKHGTGQYFNGTIDEVMIFSSALNSSQISAIYNNQSARFFNTGTQELSNQSLLNISSGNNKVNVTTYILNNLSSNINLTLGYYNGSWFYTNPQVVNSGVNLTYNISSLSTNLTLNYTFYAGTNQFYSPIIKNNIIIDYWDSILPEVNITYPLNITYNINVSALNYTVSDANLQACWYSTDNGATNTSVTCGNNLTGLTSNEGSNIWLVGANDSSNNINTSRVTFFKDTIFPLISYGVGTENNSANVSRNWIYVNVSVTETNFANITFTLRNSTAQVNSTIFTSATYTINWTNLVDTNYTYNVSVRDTANNFNSTETRLITLDTTSPTISLISPTNNTGDSDGNITFSYNVSDAQSIVNCSLIINNIINQTNTTISKDTTINFSLSNLAASGLNWSVNCTDPAGNTGKSEERILSIVLSTDFSGKTTDLSSVNISNITNLIIENPEHGMINYSEAVDLSEGADINTYVNISFNRIEINSTALSSLNKTARLSFYNLTYSNPRPVKDGTECPSTICTEVSYSSGTFIYNVTGFSVYSAEETPTTPAPTSSPGGGGGAIKYECMKDEDCNKNYSCYNNKCVKLFDIKIIRIDSPISPGEFLDFTYFVKGMAEIKGDVVIDFWLEKDNRAITSGKDTIYFGTFEEKTETTNMFLPRDVEDGIYRFYIQTDYQGHKTSSYREIEVTKTAVSTLDINLLHFPSVREGQLINFSFIVGFNKDSLVLVKLKEKIKKGEEVFWENETEIEINRSITIQEEAIRLKSGKYQLEIKAEYENKELKFLYEFSVRRKINYWLFLLLIPIIVLFVFIIWRRKAKKKEEKEKSEEIPAQPEEKPEEAGEQEEATEEAEEKHETEKIKEVGEEQEELGKTKEAKETVEEEEAEIEETKEKIEKEEIEEKPFYEGVTSNTNEENLETFSDKIYDSDKQETEEKKSIEEKRISEVIGMVVYSNNEKIGNVEDVYIENHKIYGWLIKLEKEIAGKLRCERILFRTESVVAINEHIEIKNILGELNNSNDL